MCPICDRSCSFEKLSNSCANAIVFIKLLVFLFSSQSSLFLSRSPIYSIIFSLSSSLVSCLSGQGTIRDQRNGELPDRFRFLCRLFVEFWKRRQAELQYEWVIKCSCRSGIRNALFHRIWLISSKIMNRYERLMNDKQVTTRNQAPSPMYVSLQLRSILNSLLHRKTSRTIDLESAIKSTQSRSSQSW